MENNFTGGWDKEAIELICDVTMCARWEPVMVKVTDRTSHPPQVTIVNTSSNKVSIVLVNYVDCCYDNRTLMWLPSLMN